MTKKTDIWMPLYIPDYLADTADLNAEHSGCYLHWLMHYWRKGPLPDDVPALICIGKLDSEQAPDIAKRLLDKFFCKNGDGMWHQKRADLEKTKAEFYHGRASLGGQARAAASRDSNGRFTQPIHGETGNSPDKASVTAGKTQTQTPPNLPASPASPPASTPASPASSQLDAQLKSSTSPSQSQVTGTTSQLPKDEGWPAAASFSSPIRGNEFQAEAHMVAKEVGKAIGMTSHWAYDEIVKQATLELQNGITMDSVRDGMITQYRRYEKCVTEGKTKSASCMNAQRFFGEAIWKDSRKWGLKKGMTAD